MQTVATRKGATVRLVASKQRLCLRGTVCTRSIAQTDLEEVAHQLQSQEHTVRLLNRAVPMKTSARMQPSDHTSMR